MERIASFCVDHTKLLPALSSNIGVSCITITIKSHKAKTLSNP